MTKKKKLFELPEDTSEETETIFAGLFHLFFSPSIYYSQVQRLPVEHFVFRTLFRTAYICTYKCIYIYTYVCTNILYVLSRRRRFER